MPCERHDCRKIAENSAQMTQGKESRFAVTPCPDWSAEERTRTSTPLREPAPEAGASANSATSAHEFQPTATFYDAAKPSVKVGSAEAQDSTKAASETFATGRFRLL